MASRVISLLSLLLLPTASSAAESVYDIEAEDLESGLPVPLSHYKGKVMLVTNVASQCGFTDSSYAQLNKLHDKYAKRGLAILAFPCNDFGAQEPGTDDEIFAFATKKKRAKFDLFRKVNVNGPQMHPLFKMLVHGDGGHDCTDDDASCAAWAAQGECDKNEAFMSASCRLSCKLCKPDHSKQPGDNPIHPRMNFGQPIKWNFESFLLSREGELMARFITGADLLSTSTIGQIEALLAAKAGGAAKEEL